MEIIRPLTRKVIDSILTRRERKQQKKQQQEFIGRLRIGNRYGRKRNTKPLLR